MFFCFICVCTQLHPRPRENQRTVHARRRRRTTANYRSLHVTPQVVNASTPLDVDAILSSLNEQIDHFNERGSGWILERVTRLQLIITEYRPLCGGSSYMKIPKRIADKEDIINVRNDKPGEEDQKCFIWAILSCLHDEEVPVNKERLSHYRGHETTLNVVGITIPVQLNRIPHFENQNPDISVNVITIDRYDDFEGKYSFCIDYESPHRNRTRKVSLLLLEDEDDPTQKHYTWIINFSRLMGDRTNHQHKSFVCSHCLHVFRTQQAHDNHLPSCLAHPAQHVHYPVEDPYPLNLLETTPHPSLSFLRF